MSVLVVDVGTSGVRAAIVRPDGTTAADRHVEALPESPADGLVEFDAGRLAELSLDVARAAIDAAGPAEPVEAVGISNQRASAVVWERGSGVPVGPGLGWQDLRTVGTCLGLRGEGLRLAPNHSATKYQWLLDTHDPARERDLCCGTVDSWLVWHLTGGRVHVTDATNAAVTGLQPPGAPDWDDHALAVLGIPRRTLPAIVDSTATVGEATALPGTPPITALLGDQQASLVGQGCVRRGDAKITFGTGGMLDLNLGPDAPAFEQRGAAGTFPIVAWRHGGTVTWGIESVMLAAGTNVQWLCDLGLLRSSAESDEVAAGCDDSGGVVFVPAPLGLGTPHWDYGARGALFGLTRGSGRAEVVRAVLEGVAQRGADLVEAAEADSKLAIATLRVDGGMSDNATFLQALADAAGRPVEVSPVREATARGAALLAGLAAGYWGSIDDLEGTWSPRVRVEPRRALDRDRWRDAVARARAWIPDLSAIDF